VSPGYYLFNAVPYVLTLGCHDDGWRTTPYAWPYERRLRPDNTALVIIDMQTDFCGKGGYVDTMGYDLSLTRAPIEPISAAGRHARPRATRSSTPAKATAPT
jgi:hypothetical protein